jgi:hypothetical protein
VSDFDLNCASPVEVDDLDLAERFPQRVTVIRIARKATHINYEAFAQYRGDTHLAAELIAHPGLAFGDAIHFGSCRA